MSAPVCLYEDDSVQLWHGDYRDGLAALTERPAAVLTDPPYGGATKFPWDVWPTGWPADVAAITNDLWCFGSLPMFWQQYPEFTGWKLSQEVVWEKHNGSGLRKDRFRRVHELAVQFYRGRWDGLYHVTPKTADATKRTVRRKHKPTQHQGVAGPSTFSSEDGGPRLMRSVIKARSENGRAVHPTQKPVSVLQALIEYSVPPGGLVVDIFAGSASTAIAARHAGRRSIVFEVREQFAHAAARRLSQQSFILPTERTS